ncbi:MAG: glutamate-1-semialdehyde 2,1-aminomutase [Firmicutes bacterium]|nr:glutamate-1-semialdehyde 2,1-aminomutase [Bacillota bacterium]
MVESEEWFKRAQVAISGGVNSPARSFAAVGGGTPPVMTRGQGAHLFDVDGRRYIDYLAAFGPLVLGHAHPRVVAAVEHQMKLGSLLGTPTDVEILLAEELVRSVRGVEQVRLTTTGTEAVMSVIRLARAVTGRNLLVKFEGTYHGHSDPVLAKAGSGVATGGGEASLGVPLGVTQDVITLPYNNLEAVARVMRTHGPRVALVLTEPIVGNMGIVEPAPGYLEGLAELSHQYGALLAFDEVITAYRFRYGAVAEALGVIPDLYALGKVIGGGLAQGAYGGRRDLMGQVAPLGGMFQAGTLAGNPLSAAAGLATLSVLRTESPYATMANLAEYLAQAILDRARRRRLEVTINRVGSAFTLFFGSMAVVDYASAQRADAVQFARFHQLMLTRGIYLAPSRFEAWFISAQHRAEDVEQTIGAVDEVFAIMADH